MNDAQEPDDRPGSNTAVAIIEPATGMTVPVRAGVSVISSAPNNPLI
jgi:hypothetical protein